MVSIIIPVYNAEKYLEECLESVIHQTYANIEIICVDDGSTDHSLSILKKYQAKDSRFAVLHERNQGQGSARNYALSHANGEFVMYVDADDWLEQDCVEILVKSLYDSAADVVIGRIAKTFFESKETAIVLTEWEGGTVTNENKKEAIFHITTYPFARLIKKKLLIDHNISFKNHYFEDVAIFPVIYAVASKIMFISRVVYHYRNNQGSTVNRMDVLYDRIKCLNTLTCELKKRDLYRTFEKELIEYILERCQINLRCVKGLCNRFYMDFEESQNKYIQNNFDLDNWRSAKIYTFGSYNLMIIAKIFMGYEDSAVIDNYYGGQSIISCMSINNCYQNRIKVFHKNSFRRTSLLQDFEKKFAHLNPGEFHDIDYLFVDLLEERFDIAECGEDEYFTLSEYFMDISEETDIDYNVIKSFSDKWFSLWTCACQNYTKMITKYIPEDRIVLVKMKLSETYYSGNEVFDFDDLSGIRNINDNLEKCYEIFIRNAPGAKVICVDKFKDFNTNKAFRHGCYPWHLNDGFYLSASKYIKRKLYDERTKM